MSRVKTSKPWECGISKMTGFGEIKLDKDGLSQEISQEAAEALAKASPSLHLCDDKGNAVLPEPIQVADEDKIHTEEVIDEEALKDELNEDVEDFTATQDNAVDTMEDEDEDENQDENQGAGVSKLTAEDLEKLKMGDIRDILLQIEGVTEEDLAQFKGTESKPALIEFTLSKI